jgi:hypothetical protein
MPMLAVEGILGGNVKTDSEKGYNIPPTPPPPHKHTQWSMQSNRGILYPAVYSSVFSLINEELFSFRT